MARLTDAEVVEIKARENIALITFADVRALADECLARGAEIKERDAQVAHYAVELTEASIRLVTARRLLEDARGAIINLGGIWWHELADEIAAFLGNVEAR